VGRRERRILTDVAQLEHFDIAVIAELVERLHRRGAGRRAARVAADRAHALRSSREGDRATAIVIIAALMQVLDQLDGGAVPAAVGLVVRRRAGLGLDVQSPSRFSSFARYFSRADARCRSHAVLPNAVLR
jgi:hypothetical protein